MKKSGEEGSRLKEKRLKAGKRTLIRYDFADIIYVICFAEFDVTCDLEIRSIKEDGEQEINYESF